MVSLMQLGEKARQQAVEQIGKQEAEKPKYGNKRTKFKSLQGFTVFADSKLEAALFVRLDQEMVAGHVAWWLPHVRFPLPGKVTYECDALAMRRNISSNWVLPVIYDAKGFMTQTSKNKIKQVEELYGVKIELVRK